MTIIPTLKGLHFEIGQMKTVREIQDAVRQLTPQHQSEFRKWYHEFDADQWDRQFEADVNAGRLDWLVKEARQDCLAGRCTER